MKYYAGIGSRETPGPILERMAEIAARRSETGIWTLRSGHAPGADQAFEVGADGTNVEIYLPWASFEKQIPIHRNAYAQKAPSLAAYVMAGEHHPAWRWLKQGAKSLHARNSHQIFGRHLDNPVSLVICWTPDGAETADEVTKHTGGTGQAIRLACANGIPVYNLKNGHEWIA